jgi:hypothetical protein
VRAARTQVEGLTACSPARVGAGRYLHWRGGGGSGGKWHVQMYSVNWTAWTCSDAMMRHYISGYASRDASLDGRRLLRNARVAFRRGHRAGNGYPRWRPLCTVRLCRVAQKQRSIALKRSATGVGMGDDGGGGAGGRTHAARHLTFCRGADCCDGTLGHRVFGRECPLPPSWLCAIVFGVL